jgi:mannose-6-phosphate isomerase-like protein (cupin superfamily)
MRKIAVLLGFCASMFCQERQVDPTFLRRSLSSVKEQPADISSPTCRYKPVFGAGDRDHAALRGIARYGEAVLDPGGASTLARYSDEEQVYVVLEGSAVILYGTDRHPLKKFDFLYLPPGVPHRVENTSAAPFRYLIMGFRVPAEIQGKAPSSLLIANIDDVPKQTVGGHPPSTQYRLLMGDVSSKRDRLAAGRLLTSLFVMEFTPGGTNIPHHHEDEEEIYLVLEGHGDMVAGGGMDGIEGRFASTVGDAWFFRLNCTVGFYNNAEPPAAARILAVRSRFPGRP